jgi:hypothetical protein
MGAMNDDGSSAGGLAPVPVPETLESGGMRSSDGICRHGALNDQRCRECEEEERSASTLGDLYDQHTDPKTGVPYYTRRAAAPAPEPESKGLETVAHRFKPPLGAAYSYYDGPGPRVCAGVEEDMILRSQAEAEIARLEARVAELESKEDASLGWLHLQERVAELEAELSEERATRALIMGAADRALTAWRAAGPGREQVIPDLAEHIRWAFDQVAELEALVEMDRKVIVNLAGQVEDAEHEITALRKIIDENREAALGPDDARERLMKEE